MAKHIRIVNEDFKVVRMRQVSMRNGQILSGIGVDGVTYNWVTDRNIITYTTSLNLPDSQLITYAREMASYFHTHDKDFNNV